MIVYTSKCLSCTNKELWSKIKAFARKHKLTVDIRRTNRPDVRLEAEKYGIDEPFAVHGKVALSLTEDLEGLLK